MPQIKKTLIHETKAVTANATLTFNVPSFDTIDDILLQFTGSAATKANIISSITKIALNINGQQVINTSPARLYAVYEMLGNEVNNTSTRPANVLNLNVGRLMFLMPENEDYFAWGCADIQTIQVQIYCGGTITGLSNVTLYTERRPILTSLGSYIKIISYPQSVSGSGVSTVDTLPRDAAEGYLSLMVWEDSTNSGQIASGEVIVNGVNITDDIPADVNAMSLSTRDYSPVSDYYTYIFADRSGRGFLPMVGVTELRLKTRFSAAPTTGVYDIVAVSLRGIPAEMAAMYNSTSK